MSSDENEAHFEAPEMAGYQRAAKLDGFPVPEKIMAHLEICMPCQKQWELVEKLDHVLKRHRREGAPIVVRQLKAVDPT